jgi:hypothetical protein
MASPVWESSPGGAVVQYCTSGAVAVVLCTPVRQLAAFFEYHIFESSATGMSYTSFLQLLLLLPHRFPIKSTSCPATCCTWSVSW